MYLLLVGRYVFLCGKSDEILEDVLLVEVLLKALPILLFLQFFAVLIRVLVGKLIGKGEVHHFVVIGGVEGSVPPDEDIWHDASSAMNDPSGFWMHRPEGV